MTSKPSTLKLPPTTPAPPALGLNFTTAPAPTAAGGHPMTFFDRLLFRRDAESLTRRATAVARRRGIPRARSFDVCLSTGAPVERHGRARRFRRGPRPHRRELCPTACRCSTRTGATGMDRVLGHVEALRVEGGQAAKGAPCCPVTTRLRSASPHELRTGRASPCRSATACAPGATARRTARRTRTASAWDLLEAIACRLSAPTPTPEREEPT